MANLWRPLALLVLLCLSPAVPAQPPVAPTNGGERILLFASDIQIRPDGSLEVAETIRIAARGERIRHGIYRDFPTRSFSNGGPREFRFEVAGVTRDGRPEPWRTEPVENGVRVMIGDGSARLASGTYTYRIRYRTTGRVGSFPDYDELYWNVTGNGWVFAIERAQVRIRLPARVRFGDRAVYTGATGSREADARATAERPGDISFATTRRLEPGEGLTVAVAWPKGVVGARRR